MIGGENIAAGAIVTAEARVDHEAAQWLEVIERTIKPQEALALRHWLTVSAHRDTIVRRCKLWHGPEVLAVLRELVPVDSLSERVERQYGRMVLAIFLAVSGIGFATVMIAVSKILPGSVDHLNSHRAEASFHTVAGERRAIRLPDGGTMFLNASTRVLVSYGPRFRDITLLRGEAAFDVVGDAAREFRVFVSPRQFVAERAARFIASKVDAERVNLTVVQGEVLAPAGRRRAPLPPSLIRARVDTGAHVFVARESGVLGEGWQTTAMLDGAEVSRLTAWQAVR